MGEAAEFPFKFTDPDLITQVFPGGIIVHYTLPQPGDVLCKPRNGQKKETANYYEKATTVHDNSFLVLVSVSTPVQGILFKSAEIFSLLYNPLVYHLS